MSKKLRIGIDFDGVIAYGSALKRAYIKEKFGFYCSNPSKFHSGLTKEQYTEMIAELYNTSKYLKTPEINGAKNYLKKLKKEGHKVFIITLRTDSEIKYTKQWLQQHNISEFEEIINTNNGPKSEACKKINLDLFIDDYPTMLEELKGIVPNIIIFNPENPESWDNIFPEIEKLSK